MKLYEIDQALLDLTDPETGEIMDISAFQALTMERERKLEGMACWIKDLAAESEALKKEEDALRMRRQKTDIKRQQVFRYLQQMLAGEKLKTPRVAVSYRRNPVSVRVSDEPGLIAWAQEHSRKELLTVTTVLSKAAVKDAINAGDEIPGAELVQETRMVIS